METDKEKKQRFNGPRFLTCEHRSIYLLLSLSAGMLGAYTFNVRGGVFCNAQTANVVLMGLCLGKGQLRAGLYYLIPIFAYCLGAFVSEALPLPIKNIGLFRWDTCLIAAEMAAFFAAGFLPLSAPDQVVQVLVNFLASMQYNTFRQAEGVPMATTFCTNHIRQIGIALASMYQQKNMDAWKRGSVHLQMVLSFLGGAIALTFVCQYFPARSIWTVLVPLGIVLVRLGHADLTSEHNLLERKPAGH